MLLRVIEAQQQQLARLSAGVERLREQRTQLTSTIAMGQARDRVKQKKMKQKAAAARKKKTSE